MILPDEFLTHDGNSALTAFHIQITARFGWKGILHHSPWPVSPHKCQTVAGRLCAGTAWEQNCVLNVNAIQLAGSNFYYVCETLRGGRRKLWIWRGAFVCSAEKTWFALLVFIWCCIGACKVCECFMIRYRRRGRACASAARWIYNHLLNHPNFKLLPRTFAEHLTSLSLYVLITFTCKNVFKHFF